MKVKFHTRHIEVFREPGDKKYYGVVNAAGESKLLHAIKKKLNSMGFDLIKKRMYKDGHLKDDLQQYLRTRKPSGDPAKDVMIYNGMWAIDGAEVAWNLGSCKLALETDVFNLEE